MANPLIDLLISEGAQEQPDGRLTFSQTGADAAAAIDQQTSLCYRRSQGIVAIEGPDSAKFLQGQLTCNILDLSDGSSLAGAYCTPQGRMVSSFQIAQLQADKYYLRMHQSIVEGSSKVLGKYIVFSKAELSDRSDEYVILGIAGPQCREALQTLSADLPTQKNQLQQSDNLVILQIDDAGQRYELWTKAEQAVSTWRTLSQHCEAVDEGFWNLLDISAGLGQVVADTAEMFIPQMLNYDIIEAVSFNKGCYTGQEIIARLHYRGKAKRRLYRCKIDHDGKINAADPLFSENAEQSIGNIVLAEPTSAQSQEILAVISTEAFDNGAIFLSASDGPKLQPLPLPYAIT